VRVRTGEGGLTNSPGANLNIERSEMAPEEKGPDTIKIENVHGPLV